MKTKNNDIIMQNKVFLWIVFATGLILSIPLVSQWPWTRSDFIIMGALIIGAGSLFVLVARVASRKYRALIGIAILAAVLWLWVELAVGLFTNWGS